MSHAVWHQKSSGFHKLGVQLNYFILSKLLQFLVIGICFWNSLTAIMPLAAIKHLSVLRYSIIFTFSGPLELLGSDIQKQNTA